LRIGVSSARFASRSLDNPSRLTVSNFEGSKPTSKGARAVPVQSTTRAGTLKRKPACFVCRHAEIRFRAPAATPPPTLPFLASQCQRARFRAANCHRRRHEPRPLDRAHRTPSLTLDVREGAHLHCGLRGRNAAQMPQDAASTRERYRRTSRLSTPSAGERLSRAPQPHGTPLLKDR
jgi:hypothetical protein